MTLPRVTALRMRRFGVIYLMASWRPLGGGERPIVMLTVSRSGHVTTGLFRRGRGPRTKFWRFAGKKT